MRNDIRKNLTMYFGVYIKQGITIGRGAVIGANSVVLKDIPPYEIHAGSPAKKLKNRLEFVPRNQLRGSREEDRPYFYRGFDHYAIAASEQVGLPSFEQSSIAIPFLTNQIIRCKGFLTSPNPISIKVNIDDQPAGEYSINEQSFEFTIQMTNSQFLKREVTSYSFLNFDTPNVIGSVFSIKSIDIIDSL